MDNVGKILELMDFEFFASGTHKISPAMFLAETHSVFLDVRSQKEFETVHFSLTHHTSFLHIPINEIPQRLSEIAKDKLVGVFCSSGVRSTMVYLYLTALGFENVRIIEGGYAELVEELKPGRLLKQLSKKQDG